MPEPNETTGFQNPPNGLSDAEGAELIQTAMQLGASDAAIVASADIVVENHLAKLCNGNPPCENYGMSPSCPPHAPGPSKFQQWRQNSPCTVVVRIDAPTAVMFSHERGEVMQMLHEIVAGVEHKAVSMGWTNSKAFAGGSCKQLFCQDKPDCRVLARKGECRNPSTARPSMSGFGINVTQLMQSAGWPNQKANQKNAFDNNSTTWVCGMVLISGD